MVNATTVLSPACNMTVEKVPAFLNLIEVSPTTKTLLVGDNFTFTAYPKDQYGNAFTASVTWSSSNMTVGTVDTAGKFIASNPGTAMVNASNGSFTGTAIVTVEQVSPPTIPVLTRIVVSPSLATMTAGENQKFMRPQKIRTEIQCRGLTYLDEQQSDVGVISPSNGITGSDGNTTITYSAVIPGNVTVRHRMEVLMIVLQ